MRHGDRRRSRRRRRRESSSSDEERTRKHDVEKRVSRVVEFHHPIVRICRARKLSDT